MMQEERWEGIPTYPDYKISTNGEVFSIKRNRLLKPYNKNTYELFNEDGSSTWTIQTLLACTFLGLDITDPFRNRVLFKDGDVNNTSLDNLYVEDTSDLPGEKWRPVGKYNGREVGDFIYVSNKGRLKATRRIVQTAFKGKPVERHNPEMIWKTNVTNSGYLGVVIDSKDGGKITLMTHRAVATAFCINDDLEHKTYVNHIDGNKQNNCAENLEWCTPRENTLHAISKGLIINGKDQFKNKSVLHVESGTVYKSLAAASKAMGRASGYVGESFTKGSRCTDKEGNVWTFKLV